MRLGFTFNVRSKSKSESATLGLADDAEEEFDSQTTIDRIADVLRSLEHDVILLGDGEPMLRRLLQGPRPDLVFNIAEGTGIGRSREARVPAVLEMLGIPHTGSDPLTLAVALDKPLAKTVVATAGVAVPKGVVIESNVQCPMSRTANAGPGTWDLGPWSPPLIAKPAFEGSSKGVLQKCLIQDRSSIAGTVEELLAAYRQPILVEEFIEGDELTVGIVGNSPPQVIGVMQVAPLGGERSFIYSLEVKRDWEQRVRYQCPPRISPDDLAATEKAALAAYQALGCRDVARIDFRLRDGVPYFIEANPLPGLAPDWSDIVLLARARGIEHRDLLHRILCAAMQRYGIE